MPNIIQVMYISILWKCSVTWRIFFCIFMKEYNRNIDSTICWLKHYFQLKSRPLFSCWSNAQFSGIGFGRSQADKYGRILEVGASLRTSPLSCTRQAQSAVPTFEWGTCYLYPRIWSQSQLMVSSDYFPLLYLPYHSCPPHRPDCTNRYIRILYLLSFTSFGPYWEVYMYNISAAFR